MAKRRTGLQSKISSIFSGVPLPKKSHSNSTPSASAPKPKGSDLPEPSSSQPRVSARPILRQSVEPMPESPLASALEIKVLKTNSRRVPGRVARRQQNKLFASKVGVSPGRQKIGLVMIVVLSITLVVLVVHSSTHQHNPIASGVAAKARAATAPQANIGIDWEIPEEYPKELRDPMELPTQMNIEKPDLIVRGIVSIEDRLFAIIDKQLVGEGETVNGATIVKMDVKNVEFEIDGRKFSRTKTSDLVVRGISHSEKRRLAIIGIDTVAEGKEIFGVTVVKINRSSVEFEMNGKRWTQKVEGEQK